MTPNKRQPESEGFLKGLAQKVTPNTVAMLGLGAALSNSDIREALISTANASTTTISATSDYDTDFGTNWTPSGGAACLMGVQPNDLTGGVGFRADACAGTLEVSSDGLSFDDVKPDILTAISAAGFTYDGEFLAACDSSNSFDELLMNDLIGGKLFVAGGLSTGAVTDIKELQGTPSGCGYIDETTGQYYAIADTRGFNEVHEFSETSAPVPVYSYGSTEIVDASLSSALGQGVFVESGTSDVMFDEDINSGVTTTVAPIGVTGTAFGLFEAHETGGNPTILLSDYSTLQYADVVTVEEASDPDADGDGEAASIDCDDTDSAINSSATEVCDGVDNDCNGVADGADAADVSTWYLDADGDGYGDATSTVEACDLPAGYVADSTDYNDGDASVHEEPVTEPSSCIDDTPAGPYEEGDLICLGTGGTSVVGDGDVIYDGYETVKLDELYDAADLEGLGVLDASDFGWTFEATDTDSVGAMFLGVSGFAEGDLVGTFEVYQGTFIATDALGNTTEVGVGSYDVAYNDEEEVPVDADGDGIVDDLDAFPDDKSEWADADVDGTGDNADEDDDNDGYTDSEESAAGTDPLNPDSYPTEGGGDSGDDSGDTAVDTDHTADTDDKKKEDRPGTEPRQPGCATASTPVGQPGNAPWYMVASTMMAAGIAMLRRRKTA